MKKSILLFVATFIAMNLFAQEYRSTKNEIGISYGLGISLTDWANLYGVGDGILKSGSDKRKFGDYSTFGTIGAEYFHSLSYPKLSIGGLAVISQLVDEVVSKGVVGERTSNYYSLMPALKYNWIIKDRYTFYSKAAIGIMILNISNDDYENHSSWSDSYLFPMWQATLAGIEFGNLFRGFAELGIGEQGIVLAGMKYKF